MKRDRGVALILALLVLSFLTVLGGALLTTSAIDVRISDNHKTATQTLYLAEAGIEDARELLRTSTRSATELLNIAAGPDRQLATDDDLPLIPSRQLGDVSGRYEVWLRNDNADGAALPADSNEVLTLVSIGRIGNNRKTVEVTVEKGRLPETDADPRLHTVSGLEHLASGIRKNATDVYSGGTTADSGAPGNYRIIAIDGDFNLDGGTGYGILLVRGELNVVGNITWNGLIVVVGRGVLHWGSDVSGVINGGLFVAQTRAPDGSLLATPADTNFEISDIAEIRRAERPLPYNPIAIRER